MQWLKISLITILLFGPQANSLERDMRVLTSSEFEGRPSGSEKPHRSAYYITRQFEKFDLEVHFQTFKFEYGFFDIAVGHNVVAIQPCNRTPCQLPIVITAHYDHLGKRGNRHYPGANDNASGVAVMIDIARRLQGMDIVRDIIYVATDAEEKGLHGAKAFVQKLGEQQVYMNINLDMLDLQKKNQLYALASRTLKPLEAQIEKTFMETPVKFKLFFSAKIMARRLAAPQVDWLRASDHYPFYRANIPFIYFGSGMDKNHHSVKDSLDKINFEKLTQVSSAITKFVLTLVSESDIAAKTN
ncbi:M20/M25/M40 family metallo-hydrolase [Pseudoalteromonas umbrosa]|uniref:M20/M25/M40 family metallo-hydrolase n=1 Tax=Pseudoalteromonas umbrosa TaxID=3048489 RepID=UPI0024C2BED6|nr:M20/M25/M40 family metallo-hydrolase [Pseudoalteromonas sp. B95]MDK1289304.1 M20/M25/M40 family metallo-hydrolase [Pseudoalteromonas sp. B95]